MTTDDFNRKLDEFYGLYYKFNKTSTKGDYNEDFKDGKKKAEKVLTYLKSVKANNLDRLAYISIGGADGSEVFHILDNTPINQAIILEYDSDLCEKIREKKREKNYKNLSVLEGDAWGHRNKCFEIINEWYEQGIINGIIISAFSVLHELPYRSDKNYNFITFISTIIGSVTEAYFYCKEPTKVIEWNGDVKLNINNRLSPHDLFRFSNLLKTQFNDVFKDSRLTEQADGVVMDSQLAGEVIRKLLYFIKNQSAIRLKYEIEECHVALDPVKLSNEVKMVFKKGHPFDSSVKRKVASSETLDYLINSNEIDLEFWDSQSDRVGWELNGFAIISGYYRLKRDSNATTLQEDSSKHTTNQTKTDSENPTTLIKGNSIKKFPIQNIGKDIFVDASNEFFYTQNNYLNITKDKLNEANKVCLVGMPGVGKTYIAQKIAYELLKHNSSSYEIIWWIDADDKKIDNELIKLASEIFKEESQNWLKNKTPEVEIIESLKKELELNYSSWLIIFDNAKDYGSLHELEEYAKKYLPRIRNPNCRLLLTSRNKEWEFSKRSFEIYPISTWLNEDVKKYIELPKNGHRIEVETPEQLEIFSGLPLAISIAKQYILRSKTKNRLKFSSFYINWIEYKNRLLKDPSYYRTISETQEDYLSFLTTVEISYNALTNPEKEVINILACFAPDKLPIEEVFKINMALLKSQEITSYAKFREYIITLDVLSLSEFEETNESNSIHRLIKECILVTQGQEQLVKNYKISISLLAKCFDGKVKDLLISHVDTLADAVLERKQDIGLNIVNSMQKDEKENALELFVNAGKYHFETGDIRSAENQYRSAIEVAISMQINAIIDRSIVFDLKKSLANILFLKGKISESEVTMLTNEINEYYEQSEDISSLVAYKNDVLNKIFQRQCRFNDCEKTLEEIEDVVTTHNHSIVGDLYEYMVQQYVDNDSNKLAEKLSGIHHNLGSLYWTWGRPGDYEKSSEYFVKAIDFQSKFVSALENRTSITNDSVIKDRLEKALNSKKLYLNVSRMIYGAVLGLLENFTDQWEVHKEAFFYFNSKIVSEKRRYAYTAYYMLSCSWDRESLKMGLPEGFDEKKLINDIYRYDGLLIGYDEKYDVIKKIVRLRIASKRPNLLEPENAYSEAAEAHKELWKQLEAMKYDKRYYDVDTCSVSAFLDYVQYVKKIDKNTARIVVKQALALVNEIVYPRRPELDKLTKELGL